MKNKLILFCLVVIMSIGTGVAAVNAWATGDQSGGGGGKGTGSVSNWSSAGSSYKTGLYKFDLIYRAQGESYVDSQGRYRHKLGCVVAYGGQHKGVRWDNSIINHEAKAKAYASQYGCSYVTTGVLSSLASRLYNGASLDEMYIDTYETGEVYFSAFGKRLKDAREDSSEPGNINSYGYRILIQEITCWGKGAAYGSGNDWCAKMAPRKEMANSGNIVNVVGLSYSGDLFTTKDDIGIKNSGLKGMARPFEMDGLPVRSDDRIFKKFADYYDGTGYNIIAFAPQVFGNYDYTIDAACVNCNSKLANNTAYVIQDTTDWDALEYVPELDADFDVVKEYFTNRVPGYICREEYHIKFPNANNIVEVNTGKYFTVNEDSSNTPFKAGTPNFAPITTETIAQCKKISGTGDLNVVRNHYTNTEYSLPTITLQYAENKNNFDERNPETYDTNQTLESVSDESVTSSGGIITYKRVATHKLEWDVYRYLLGGSGKALVDTKAENEADFKSKNPDNVYVDMEGPTLPISFGNKRPDSGSGKAAEVSLSFEFPRLSTMNDSFTEDNDYLKTDSTANMYKDNDVDNLKNSACAKMYGYNTTEFKTCASQRTENKIGTGNNNCYNNMNKDDYYTCPVIFETDPNAPCDPKKEICCGPEGAVCEDGSCPDENGECPPPPCPDGQFECPDGSCPTSDGWCPNITPPGKDLIYRPIDLNNPFPGMRGEGRDTGANWCGYNIRTKEINCSHDYKNNKIVDKHIQKNRKYETEEIYRGSNPMYSFVLNANTIRNIREYNSRTDYDDFNMNCNKDEFCFSNFIEDRVAGENSGSCTGVNWATCGESR